MNRHMEDLDNRGKRHNRRVRGLPETVELDQLLQTVVSLFYNLLDRPPAPPIELERIHRAFRPRGRYADPPQDVVCCLVAFWLKEENIRKI